MCGTSPRRFPTMMRLPPKARRDAFKAAVYTYYRAANRQLPWRGNPTPYRVLVSEFMLQQTQVHRVVPKYRAFLKAFPSIRRLADASLPEVLQEWQGLGYNRRGRYLWESARVIRDAHGGRVPRDVPALEALPGIGAYTARAIAAFAYDEPVVFIETNIRSALLHFFYPRAENVRDRDLMPLLEKLVEGERPHEWYAALMDYGGKIKREYGNPNSRSAHYVRQAPFKGSRREARGIIVRELLSGPQTESSLRKRADDHPKFSEALRALRTEGFVVLRGKTLALTRSAI